MRPILWRAGSLGIVAVAGRGHPVTGQLLLDVGSGCLHVWLLGLWAGQYLQGASEPVLPDPCEVRAAAYCMRHAAECMALCNRDRRRCWAVGLRCMLLRAGRC